MKRENKFQSQLIAEIKELLPDCKVLKNDPNYIQGIPDLIVLYKDRWAALECKRSSDATHQPNQDYYVNEMNEMSFAAFVYPENKEEVLNELQKTFRPRRKARVSKRK